jgi:predicted AlkP superfamily pyrophosphatase or phosphodiesterase
MTNSNLGIPSSILHHFGAAAQHTTLGIVDAALAKNYKNVVLLIFDGMGSESLARHVPDGFLMKNKVADISSVYPCSTTSALATLESGLSPAEHGRVGWTCYFKEIDACVNLLSGKQNGTDTPAAAYDIVRKNLSFTRVQEQIRRVNPSIECCTVSPFAEYKADTCEEVCAQVSALCKNPGRRYIYAYHFQPDQDMHEFGCYDARVRDRMRSFDKQIEQLAAQLSDTLLIVTADHGLADLKMLAIEDYPEIYECLSKPLSREVRSLSFFVKEAYKDDFPRRFQARLGGDFTLMTGEEALERQIFGEGKLHPRVRGFVGDYVALATGSIGLWYRNDKGQNRTLAAAHGGLSAEEMVVPLVLVEGLP